MSRSIGTTIRTHLRANDAVQQSIEWEETVSRLDTDSPLVSPPRPSHRRWWVAATAAAATLLVVGLLPILLSGEEPPLTAPSTTFEVTDVIPVGGQEAMVLDGALWVANTQDGSLNRIDLASRSVTATVDIGGDSRIFVDAAFGAIWVSQIENSMVLRIDGSTGEVTDTISVGSRVFRVAAVTEDALWINTEMGLTEIDPQTREVVDTFPTGGFFWTLAVDGAIWGYDPDGLTRFDLESRQITDFIENPLATTESMGVFADGAIWVPGGDPMITEGDAMIIRVDLDTLEVSAPIRLGGTSGAPGPGSLVFSGDALWTANSNTIFRVDIATREVTDVIPIDNRGNVMGGAGLIWVSHPVDSTVTAIDPSSRRVIATISIDGGNKRIVAIGSAVWVITDSASTRIEPRT